MTEQQRWYTGVDWASENHHVLITDGDRIKVDEKIFKNGDEVLAGMATSGAVKPDQMPYRNRGAAGPCGRNVNRYQTVAALREHGRHPNSFVDTKPDKPTEQQIVFQLLQTNGSTSDQVES